MSTTPFGPAEFIHQVASTYDPLKPDTIWASEEAVRRLCVGRHVEAWLNQELRKLAANPAADGDWGAKEITLHRGNRWSVSVALLDSAKRYIHVLPSLGIYAPLSSSVGIERYRLPESYRNDVFDPGIRVQPLEFFRVERHDVLRLETHQYAYYFQVTEPIALLRVETAPIRPLEWLFSRQTLQAWQANDAALVYTQLRVAAYVLGKIAHQSSILPLRELTKHPHHAIRWAAIQNLGRLNRSEALVKIREAINDPHPHVRRAAQKTLERLEGKGA